jgi:acyl-ACP thioesterase
MPIAANFTSVLSIDWEINFTQCYPNGYLKYSELCNILQLTAAKHSENGGISFSDMQEFNQAWVLSRMRVEISDLPKWKDIITVKTWIISLENSRSIRAFEIQLNHKKMVNCETLWIVFNTKTRRPDKLALPDAHFDKFPETKSTLLEVKKISHTETLNTIFKKNVLISDLDIVNHVNNIKYLEWCLDFVDPKLILKNELLSIDMNFLKELKLYDEIEIQECIEHKKSVYTITNENKNSCLIELNWK